MKLGARVLLATLFIGGVCLGAYWLASGQGAEKQDGQSAALEQASRILEQEIGEVRVPQVQAIKKGLKEFEKDVTEAIQSHKVDANAIAKLQPDKIFTKIKAEVQLADQYLKMSEQRREEAKNAPNAAAQYVALRDAMDKADMAQRILDPLNVVLSKPEEKQKVQEPKKKEEQGIPAARPIPSINIQSTWNALEQLKVSANLSEKGYTYAAVGEYQADATGYDPSTQTLIAPDGQSVDVRYLQGTFQNTAQQSMFEAVPVIEGQPQGVQLKESAQEKIYSEGNQKVGGVALQVTLDLLSFLHVAGFDQRGPDITIESPIIISLKELYNQVGPYSNTLDEWKTLPDDLRHPAHIERIYGFVLDPRNQDIFLVCAPASSPDTEIDIDDLVIGFWAAWSEQLTPCVSLEPLPGDPGGPQYARVSGVPEDSLFAKTMLEADYAMKRITLGGFKVDVDEFRTLLQLHAAWEKCPTKKQERRPSRSRSWFFPKVLGVGDMRVSKSNRSVLFSSGIQVLTAQIELAGMKDIGKQDDVFVQEAGLFTKCYEQFERSAQIQPNGIYVRLHGLVDIVTVGKLLRYMGIDYAILRNFSDLPYLPCEVPNYYSGIIVPRVETPCGPYALVGGVEICPRAGDYSVQWYRNRAMSDLEEIVDAFPRSEGWAASLNVKLKVPRHGSGGLDDAESLMDAGRTAFALRQYEAARANFLKVTEKNPLHTEAFVQLAISCSILGQFQEAKTAIARAIEIEPADKQLKAIELDIELHSNPKFDLKNSDETVRRILSEDYAKKVAADVRMGEADDAEEAAEFALKLWDTNAAVYFERALTQGQTFSPEKERDLLQAIRLYRKLLSEKDDSETRVRLARALAVHASGRISRIWKMIAAGTVESNSNWVLGELSEIANEALDAQRIDDHEPGCLVTEALARATKVEVMELIGQGGNLLHVRELADRAVKRFPDFPDAHSVRAYVFILAEEFAQALAEIDKAITMNPTQGSLFLLRADVYLKHQEFAKAKEALEKAKELGAEIDPNFEKKIYLHM